MPNILSLRPRLVFFLLTLFVAASLAGAPLPIGTAFTYQGRLSEGGTGYTGSADFEFELYDNDGVSIAGPITRAGVVVSDGLFKTDLEFGAVFNGQKRLLEIRVKTTAPGYTTLTPRQELTPTPYGIYATNSGTAALATNADQLDGNDSTAFALVTHTHPASAITGIADGQVVYGAGGTALTSEAQFTYDATNNNLSVANNVNAGGVYQINSGTVVRVTPTPVFNTFLGLSGNATTTGTRNTASGDGALTVVTNGISNTAVGANALAAVTGGNLAVPLPGAPEGSVNTAVGTNSLAAATTAGANTAIGADTLPATTTGSGNTAIGWRSMLLNTTGFANIAVGANTLRSNLAGGLNVAMGVFALESYTASGTVAIGFNSQSKNVSAVDNTAVGSGSLANNVAGASNVAVGNNALLANLANDNTGLGARALEATNTGASNVGVGTRVMLLNQTGTRNVAVGASALDSMTTGADNTGIGFEALTALTLGGGDNTAVGASALKSNTVGFRNTALGKDAGWANLTGTDNIYIGRSAGSSHAGSETNNIVIGNPGSSSDTNRIRIGVVTTGGGFTAHTNTRIGGIFGTTIAAGGLAVSIDGNGQLGTTVSSRRFKEDVHDMGDASDQLLRLRPVTFRYLPSVTPDRNRVEQYGLIAEEVEKVNPEWVVRDQQGEVMAVRYDQVNAALLGLVQKQNAEIKTLTSQLAELAERLERIEAARTRR